MVTFPGITGWRIRSDALTLLPFASLIRASILERVAMGMAVDRTCDVLDSCNI